MTTWSPSLRPSTTSVINAIADADFDLNRFQLRRIAFVRENINRAHRLMLAMRAAATGPTATAAATASAAPATATTTAATRSVRTTAAPSASARSAGAVYGHRCGRVRARRCAIGLHIFRKHFRRTKPQRRIRHAQRISSLRNNDRNIRRHARLQFHVVVIHADDGSRKSRRFDNSSEHCAPAPPAR